MPTLQAEPRVSSPKQQLSPAPIFETLNRYQQSLALKGAIDLELFTHIAGGATTASAIALKCRATERGVRILCDFLTVNGFLTKSEGTYNLTQESALFLNRKSPAYVGSIAKFLVNDHSLECFRDVAALVRKGGAVEDSDVTQQDNDIWVEFARSMAPIAGMSAQFVTPVISEPGKIVKVLDIAAGHGLFGISVALHNPQAEIVAVDWKNVLDVAVENATRAGVADRYRVIPGSAFDADFGSGYDLVLLPNFLHHFAAVTNIGLLKRIRAAMNPGGRVATVEFVPDDDRVSPPIAASFSIVMLGRTPHGDAYTFREFDEMFREAGFGPSRMHSFDPFPQRLIVTSL